MKGWKSVRLRVIAYRRGAETSCNWARALWPLVYRRGNWIIHWAVSSSKSLDPHHYEESGWGWQWWLRGSSTMAVLIKDSLWLPNPLVRYQQTTCGFAQFGISYFEQPATATKITLQGTMSLTDTSYNSTRPTVGLAQPWKLPPGSQKHC